MLSDLNLYYESQAPGIRSCFNALRHIILTSNRDITEAWKYKMPFFCFNGKMFCYLWVDKKTHQPYIGFVDGNLIEHELLIQEKRSRMKVLFIDPNADLPIILINELLLKAIDLKSKKLK